MAGREPKRSRLDGTVRLFVKNIDDRLTNDEIREAFAPHANIVLAYNTKKGYAFVHIQTMNEAEDLVRIMNGTKLGNERIRSRQIRVSVARLQGRNCERYIFSQLEEICYEFTKGKCKNKRNCPNGAHICGWCSQMAGKIESHSADDPCCPKQTDGYIRNDLLSADPDPVGENGADGWSEDDSQDFEARIIQTSDGINKKITDQLKKILRMKAAEATKADLDQEVKVLIDLKDQYKAATGENWKGSAESQESEEEELDGDLRDQSGHQMSLEGETAEDLSGDADWDPLPLPSSNHESPEVTSHDGGLLSTDCGGNQAAGQVGLSCNTARDLLPSNDASPEVPRHQGGADLEPEHPQDHRGRQQFPGTIPDRADGREVYPGADEDCSHGGGSEQASKQPGRAAAAGTSSRPRQLAHVPDGLLSTGRGGDQTTARSLLRNLVRKKCSQNKRQASPALRETSSTNQDHVASSHSRAFKPSSSSSRRPESSKSEAKPPSPPKPKPTFTVRDPPSSNETQLMPNIYEENLPVMVIIGSTGTGKSTLCNVMSGLQPDDQRVFPVSSRMESCTNKTTVCKVKETPFKKLSFTIIDTPGLLDPKPGKDEFNMEEMTREFGKIKFVSVFVLVFNGASPRLDTSLFTMLNAFKKIFGNNFLKNNAVLEFSNWGYDEHSVRKRGKEKNEEFWRSAINQKLEESMGYKINCPAVFIDSLYDETDSAQSHKFIEEMNKLYLYMQTLPDYALPSNSHMSGFPRTPHPGHTSVFSAPQHPQCSSVLPNHLRNQGGTFGMSGLGDMGSLAHSGNRGIPGQGGLDTDPVRRGRSLSSDTVIVRNLPCNIPLDAARRGLQKLFSQVGIVKGASYNMKERGVGIVRFSSERDAEKAVTMMNGMLVEGEKIKVKLYVTICD